MNEFIEQFILESREFVEQATTALNVLEKLPQDAEQLDALFRSFHTLKGGASIVEFAAMERAVHAAEDVLSLARAGNRAITSQLIGDCLECLDQVTGWLDGMERSGEIPIDAELKASAIVARLQRSTNGDDIVQRAVVNTAATTWLEDFVERNQSARPQAKAAVRFTPRPDCFFRGEDPLAIIAALPELLALELDPIDQWPAIDVLDPFESLLVLTALSGATATELALHLQSHAAECEIVSLLKDDAGPNAIGLPQAARKILEAQLALLGDAETQTFVGRVASAGLVAANALRYCGQLADADRIARATESSLKDKAVNLLHEAIVSVLARPVAASLPTSSLQLESVTRTFRVDAARVDALVRLTGELTVVKNAIGHVMKLAVDKDSAVAGALKNHHGVLDHITSELQTAVLGMRVLPLRTVLQRFPRVVREMSASLNKPARLLVEGDDTEADKAIVEMLFEPLLHIVRNAMDHGIESTELRAKRNKPQMATIVLRASRQGDRVLIEVNDDGGGIDVDRVRDVAIKRGVVKAEALAAMSEAQVIDLIFAPGFSTATMVTELSGRGVGMDAVRTAVARVGGTVAIESQYERGMTVTFALPFSVMMTQVMTVEAGGQMFGIPLDAIVETIRVQVDSIVGVGSAEAIVRRNRTVPVFKLANLLSVTETRHRADEAVIVIVSLAGQLGGIHVDRVAERMDVMLKPLEGLLAGISGITGTTILGDGRVLIVLDLEGILR